MCFASTASRAGGRNRTLRNALAWLDQFGVRVEFQQVPSYRRPKNRVLLQFRGPDGETRVIGAATLVAAIWRAQERCKEPNPNSSKGISTETSCETPTQG